MTISSVYNTLLKICALKGSGVTNQKAALVQKMLSVVLPCMLSQSTDLRPPDSVAAKGEEVRYLGRTLVAHLRIGAVRLTVTNALARTFCLLGPDAPGLSISPTECNGLNAVAKTIKEGKDDPRRKAVMEKLAKAEGLMRKVYVRHRTLLSLLYQGGLMYVAYSIVQQITPI